MKTIKLLKEMIAENQKTAKFMSPTDKARRPLVREVKKLKDAILLLETSPREDYLLAEINRIDKIIKSKESQYDYWVKHNCPNTVPIRSRRAFYNKEHGLNELIKQIAFLRWLTT